MIFLIAKLDEFRKDMTKIKFFRMKGVFDLTKNQSFLLSSPLSLQVF